MQHRPSSSRVLSLLPGVVLAHAGFAQQSAPVAPSAVNSPGVTADFEAPIVIAHRGASGFRPEHTIEAYLLGITQGADFIEPDLVATRDGVLIARHENVLATVALDDAGEIVLENGQPIVTGETTNIAELAQFADRLTVKSIDGVAIGGWFCEDLTLAEVKSLRTRERIPATRPDNTAFNDQFQVPTLSEVILLVQVVETLTGKKIGIYPETKHPTFFAKEGTLLDGSPIDISLGQLLVDTLVLSNFTDPSRIFIQSFEFENLIELQNSILPAAGLDLPLVQLYGDVNDSFVQPFSSFSRPYDMRYNAQQGADLFAIYGELSQLVEGGITAETGYGALIQSSILREISESYAEGIGPWKNSFLLRESLDQPVDGNGDGQAQIGSQLTGRVSGFLARALQNDLLVHPYTLRTEENFLTVHDNGVPQSITGEVVQLLSLGVNGFFIDQPVDGVEGRDLWLSINGFDTECAPSPSGDDYDWLLAAYYAAAAEGGQR